MRVLLTGPTGQVGSALLQTLPSIGEIIPASRERLDLSNPDAIRAAVQTLRPHVIVNAAAYTAVDRAEREEALAFRVNADGPAILAEEAARMGAFLVHFSTDYVFDGEKTSPYEETDAPNPLNVYGRSKLAGECAIQASGCRQLILRTSWVYSMQGNNFLLTMQRLAREGKPLRVVNDQHGAPTTSRMLADALPALITEALKSDSLEGTYHISAGGGTTWWGFARAIVGRQVTAISSAEYPTLARRPRNSMLDNSKLNQNFGVRLPSWEAGLRQVLGKRL